MGLNMSIRAEAWTLPGVGTFQRRRTLRFELLDAKQSINGVGQGRLVLSADDPNTDAIIGDTLGSLVRVFDGDTEVYSFYLRNEGYVFGGDGKVVLTGPGRERMLDDAIIYPYDYDTWPTQTRQPNWRFGGDNEQLSNESLEDDLSALGTGWENGGLDGWQQTTEGGDFNANEDFEVYFNAGEARTGGYSLRIDPSTRHSGTYKPVKVTPGKRYQFSVYLKGSVAGDRWTLSADLEGTNYTTNGFTYNGLRMAELGNVPRNPAANGLPGGSTTTSYQLTTIDAKAGDDQTSCNVYVQFDHHDGRNGGIAYIDDFTASGWGLGMEPWVATGTIDDFTVDTYVARAGTYSGKVVVNSGAGTNTSGVSQDFDTIGGRAQTVGFWVYHEEGGNEDFVAVLKSPFNGTWIASNTVSVPDSTWTRVEVTGDTEGDETTASLRYGGTGGCTFWFDTAYAYEGLGASTAGGIVQTLLTDITDRGHLTYLKADSFDNTLDSDGNAWTQTLNIEVSRGQTLLEVLADLGRFGVEWRIDWNSVAGKYELKLYETEQMGADLTGTNVRLMPRTVEKMEIDRSYGGHSVIFVEGYEGIIEVDEDASLTSNFGRRERYVGVDDIFASQSISTVVDNEIKLANLRKLGLRTNTTVFTPKVDFDLGDRIDCVFPPDIDAPHRVVSIQTTVRKGESLFTIELGRPVDIDFSLLSGDRLPRLNEGS